LVVVQPSVCDVRGFPLVLLVHILSNYTRRRHS